MTVSSTDVELHLFLPEEHLKQCSHTHSIGRFSVYDQKARLRQCRVQTCDGEEVAVSLIRHYLWPSTPSQPAKAIHIGLMEQLYDFVIGSHVSLYRSCQAMQSFANRHTTSCSAQKLDLYLTANRFLSFRFFRKFDQKIFHLRDDLPQTICDACPKNSEEGELFICMDACFGLVHKLKSKQPCSSNAEDSQFLCNNEEVQEFVQQARSAQTIAKDSMSAAVDCSNFSAGDTVIAATKNKGLSVKGVFGASCRHQQPLLFLDMKHGERFSYPSFLLRSLRSENPDIKATVLYDVGCKFEKYFKRTEPTLCAGLTFKVPVFHSYAHSVACQLAFNPRISGSCGLCDGEGQERLWSVLQQSSKQMKEMSCSNRLSFLDDILYQYSTNTNESMIDWIDRRREFAKRVETESKDKLSEILATIDSTATAESCTQWHADISASLAKSNPNMTHSKQEWHRTYVANLSRLQSLRQQIKNETSPAELTKLQGEENGTISALQAIEHRRGISERWQCDDILFRTVQDQLHMEQLMPILQCMFKATAELRHFRDLMKKFCPGQDAARRIKDVAKQSRRSLLANLRKYNQAPKPLTPQLPESLKEEQVCDPDSSQWAYIHMVTNCGDIDPLVSLKLSAIQTYGRYKSAKVEHNLLRMDLGNVRRSLREKIAVLMRLVSGDHMRNVKYPLYLSRLNALTRRLEILPDDFEIEETLETDDVSGDTDSSSESDSEYEL